MVYHFSLKATKQAFLSFGYIIKIHESIFLNLGWNY